MVSSILAIAALTASASAAALPRVDLNGILTAAAGLTAGTRAQCTVSAGVQQTNNILTCIPVQTPSQVSAITSTNLNAMLGAQVLGLPINVNGQAATSSSVTANAQGTTISGYCPTGFAAFCCSSNTTINGNANAGTSLGSGISNIAGLNAALGALINAGVNNVNLGCVGASIIKA